MRKIERKIYAESKRKRKPQYFVEFVWIYFIIIKAQSKRNIKFYDALPVNKLVLKCYGVEKTFDDNFSMDKVRWM